MEQTQNAWLEPLKEWLKDAQTLEEVADLPTQEPKKVAAQKIFGSNLSLLNQKIEFTPTMQWAALRAALQNSPEMELSCVLVDFHGVARTHLST